MSIVALVVTLTAQPTPAQTGLSSLPEVEFSQLSQRDPNPLGEKALSINSTQWKHGETEHFIYHFAHTYVATPISVEAEFHYRVVAKELERDQPLTDIKSNVYIFERPEDWQQFQGLGELERWTGGIHSQGSLFILRNPEQKFSGNVLGHEIVHLVLHRFYSDGIPCWLNEGIAQYISKSAHASYQRARGYISKPHSEAVAADDIIALATLARLTRPPSDRVETFMMNRSGWCAFWLRPISRAFWRCSMRWGGISRSKLRCRELIPQGLGVSQPWKKNSANTRPRISARPCSRRKSDGRGARP
jgi:hypothetical protein